MGLFSPVTDDPEQLSRVPYENWQGRHTRGPRLTAFTDKASMFNADPELERRCRILIQARTTTRGAVDRALDAVGPDSTTANELARLDAWEWRIREEAHGSINAETQATLDQIAVQRGVLLRDNKANQALVDETSAANQPWNRRVEELQSYLPLLVRDGYVRIKEPHISKVDTIALKIAEIYQAEGQLADLANRPVPIDEAKRRVRDRVASEGLPLRYNANGGISLPKDSDDVRKLLFWAVPEKIIASLNAQIDEAYIGVEGISGKDRTRLVKKLQAEIATCESVIATLVWREIDAGRLTPFPEQVSIAAILGVVGPEPTSDRIDRPSLNKL